MTLGIATGALVFAANAVLGVVTVISVYNLMETNVALGAVGGLGVGVAVIYAEWQVGERMLTLTVNEMKILVVVAAIGAVAGVVGTMLTVEPDL